MLVKYNKQNILNLPLVGTGVKAKHETGKKKGQPMITFRVMPGLNQVPKALMDHFENHPTVKLLVEDGDIEFVEFKTEAKGNKKAKVIGKDDTPLKVKDLNAKDAKAAIKDMENIETLEEWLAEETRATTKKEIQKKLDKINQPVAQ